MRKIITKTDVTFLDVKKIKKNPLNTFGEDKYDDLKNSIITYGLITPITVIGPDENGCYVLIAGEQRLRVYESMRAEGVEGYDKIAAYIVGDINMSETEQSILIESSNIDNRDSFDRNAHCFQIVKLLKKLEKEQGLTKGEYIKLRTEYLKCSERYARFYQQIFNSDNSETLEKMVTEGEISLTSAGRIATLPANLQESAINDIKELNQSERKSKKEQDSIIAEYTKKDKESKGTTEKKKTINDDYILDSELDMFDSIGGNSFSNDDYDSNGSYENDDDFNFDFDDFDPSILNVTSSVGASMNDDKKELDTKAVLQWCDHMKNVDSPTESEWKAIEACKKIVEKFF